MAEIGKELGKLWGELDDNDKKARPVFRIEAWHAVIAHGLREMLFCADTLCWLEWTT